MIPSQERFHLYLLIGQSNMAGRAPIEDQDKAPLERCFLLNAKNEWERATAPLGRYSTVEVKQCKLNPGYTFAQKMVEAQPGISIGLIVNAKGGTNIAEWKKGGQLYNEAVRRTRLAQETGVVKGILWHQGESDEKNTNYLTELKVFIEDLRGDLGTPDVPFIAGQVNDVKLINDDVARLPFEVAHTAFVSSDGLTCLDRWHFDSKSMRLLGERYAAAMLRELER